MLLQFKARPLQTNRLLPCLVDDAFCQELVLVHGQLILFLLDDFVHQGMGEVGFIDLIVAVFSVAHNVNDDVRLPSLSPFRCKLAHLYDT